MWPVLGQAIQGADALGKFLAKTSNIVPHLNPAELHGGGPIVPFKRLPSEIEGREIIIRLQVEHGGDAGFALKSLNIINVLGKRTDEELGNDLDVVHIFPDSSRAVAKGRVSPKKKRPLAALGNMHFDFTRCRN